MNVLDSLTLWYDLFTRELNRGMDKIHKLEKPTNRDVLSVFKFSTEFADAGIKQLEVKKNELGIEVEDEPLAIMSVKSMKEE